MARGRSIVSVLGTIKLPGQPPLCN